MKNLFTIIAIAAICATSLIAKEISVDISKKRTESVYFNLNTEAEVTVPNDNWDISFMNGVVNAAIRINGGQGVRLWHVTDGSIADYNNPLDTNGKFDIWKEYINGDKTWTIGAFNLGHDGFAENTGDYGWGQYSQTVVEGTELFVIKLRNGDYKKIAISELSTGIYYFIYSDLNNENQKSEEVSKSDTKDKLFSYFDLEEGKAIDREPLMSDWDLEFSKYVELVTGQGVTQPYPVVGIRANQNIKIAQLDGVDVNNTPKPKDEDFSYVINEIGWDWKEYDFNTNAYKVVPERVYYVQRYEIVKKDTGLVELPVGALNKIVFTGFDGSKFTFELNGAVASVSEKNDNNKFAVTPNIVNRNENLNLIYAGSDLGEATLNIYSATGQNVYTQSVNLTKNLQISNINASDLSSGIYFIRIQKNNSIYTQKFIVK